MTLQEIVKLASQVAELGNVVVPRDGYVDSLSKRGVLDQIAEDDVRQVCSAEYERLKIVSVNRIAEGVKKLAGLRAIEFQSATAESGLGTVYSFVIQREGANPLIVWNNNIDLCWRRFAVTKELGHLLMLSLNIPQEKECGRAIDGDKWLKGLTENTALDAEASAFLIALELLLPWSLREQLSLLLSSELSPYHIAKVFFLPTYIINTFLFDNGDDESYRSLSNRINEKIHGVNVI